MAYQIIFPKKGANQSAADRWKNGNFTNRYFFDTVLQKHPEIAIRLINEAAPDLHVTSITYINKEERQEPSGLSKLVYLDVKAVLKDGRTVMIEMQVRPQGTFIRRLRQYRSEYDVLKLNPGDSYDRLPDVIQIAVCCFDPVGTGSYIYDYEMRDRYTSNTLSANGQRLILLNSKGHHGEISDELKSFFTYINGDAAEGKLVQMIDDSVAALKYDEAERGKFMKLADYIEDEVDEQLDEIYEEGVKKGIETGIFNGFQMLKSLGFDDEAAIRKTAEQYGRSCEEVKEIVSKNTSESR